MIFPGGAICGALLGGALGYVEVQPFVHGAGEIMKSGTDASVDMMTKATEQAGPIGAIASIPVVVGTEAATGVISGAVLGVGFAIAAGFTVVGSIIGIPTTWAGLKIFTEPTANQSNMLKPAVKDQNAPLLRFSGKLEKFLSNLNGALEPLG